MATATVTVDRSRQRARSAGIVLPSLSLWQREIVRFYRQKGRVAGVILSPLLFWLVIGSGFGTSFRGGPGGAPSHYLDYFYPGALVMIVLFTAIFAMMSVIEDRKEGFLLSVLAAPINRSVIVLGKVLGGSTLAAAQGIVFLVFLPLIHVYPSAAEIGLAALITFLVAFALTALGFAIAWPMDSTAAFHAIVNLFMIPLWLLSGALFPMSGASGWIAWIMRLNPLTYGVEGLRAVLFPGATSPGALPVTTDLLVLVAFSAAMFALCFYMANRRSTKPAA